MLESPKAVRALLRCPKTGDPLEDRDGRLVTVGDGEAATYDTIDGKPVLVDFTRSVLVRERIFETRAGRQITERRYGTLARALKRMVSPPKTVTRDNVAHLVRLLKERTRSPRVLVVGGGSIGQNMEPIYDDPEIRVVAFDIYDSPHVQFVADAHQIPLADASVDGVIVQAVLEHVLDPNRVVEEIWRVLQPDGLVYAETPFLQHVHEGAYDFTRFTESGHRWLFRRFGWIASGTVGGPSLVLLWSIDYFVAGLFRSRRAGKLAKTLVFWVQYLDRWVPERYAIDGACGCHFLGRKSETGELMAEDIILYYQGAQA
jgi:SAM-dependent methyltransferase